MGESMQHVTSGASRELLSGLFDRDPSKRLGGGPGGGEDVKRASFFAGDDFDAVLAQSIPVPFRPDVSGPADTKYFGDCLLKDNIAEGDTVKIDRPGDISDGMTGSVTQ